MQIKQISVFISNQKGSLADLTDILIANSIDIRAISVFDTADFGILRMVVNDPDKAVEVLQREGFVAKVTKVLAVEPTDEPGSLNHIFTLMKENGINIDYIYSFVMRRREMPYIVLKADDLKKAADVLISSGINVVNKEEVYNGR